MKVLDMVFQSGSLNANPPDWLLPFVWVAVAILLLVCAALVALVLARWLCLWRRSRGSFSRSWPFALAPLDGLERRSHYVCDRQDPLITHEDIILLEASGSSSGDLP
jgi:hypothetical protein